MADEEQRARDRVLRLIAVAEQVMLAGFDADRAVQVLERDHGCTRSSARRIARAVKNRWENNLNKSDTEWRAHLCHMTFDLYRRALKDGKYQSALGALRTLGQQLDVVKAERLELEITGLDHLTDGELALRLVVLRERLGAGAQELAGGTDGDHDPGRDGEQA